MSQQQRQAIPPQPSVPKLWLAGLFSGLAAFIIAAMNFLFNDPGKKTMPLVAGSLVVLGIWIVRIYLSWITHTPSQTNSTGISPGNHLTQPSSYPPYPPPQRPPPPRPLFEITQITQITQPQTRPSQAPKPDPSWLETDELFSLQEQSLSHALAFSLPKRDAESLDCEDRYALGVNTWRFAVADGVGGSELPRPWARIIARTYVEQPDHFKDQASLEAALPALSEEWTAWVKNVWFSHIYSQEPSEERDLDFFRRLRAGAQTTFVGCAVSKQGGGWRIDVAAVGDADFFHFSRDKENHLQLQSVFPVKEPEDFGRTPHTLLTNLKYAQESAAWMQATSFAAHEGDVLVLATDSLARWLLEQIRAGGEQWEVVVRCMDPSVFERLIADARDGKDGKPPMEDDDVTMVVVRLPGKSGRQKKNG